MKEPERIAELSLVTDTTSYSSVLVEELKTTFVGKFGCPLNTSVKAVPVP